MFKNVVKEIQKTPLGHLTAVYARPGDGIRTFTLELANDLAMQGFTVCYCSITRTKEYLEGKLLPNIHILSALPQNATYTLTRLTESSKASGVVVLVDNLLSFVLQEGLKQAPAAYNKTKIQTELLLKTKETSIQKGLQVIVTDNFVSSSNTDNLLSISKEALELCDKSYILYKDSITVDTPCSEDATMLKLKEIELLVKDT